MGLALFGNPPKPINNGFYTLRHEKRKAMDGWLWHRMQHCVQCKNRVPFILWSFKYQCLYYYGFPWQTKTIYSSIQASFHWWFTFNKIKSTLMHEGSANSSICTKFSIGTWLKTIFLLQVCKRLLSWNFVISSPHYDSSTHKKVYF